MNPLLPRFLTTALVSAALSVGGAPAARAQALLKQSGGGAAVLIPKSADVHARIGSGQFAVTDLDLVFANPVRDQVEADFVYALPDGAVVTDFSYYYRGERVTARAVEKQRAAAIYAEITSRNRDPALIEMVGKNRFRARIFPVEPEADLRVRIKIVQALPLVRGAATYVVPLRPDAGDAGARVALERLNVSVRVEGGEGIQTVNNLGIPGRRGADGSVTYALSGRNYRPTKDLRVSLARPRPAPPLYAALRSAPSGGADGFFCLALTPAVPLKAPVRAIVRGNAVTTYDVVPLYGPGALKGSRTLVVCGRYRGAGAAQVLLKGGDGQTVSAPAVFGREPEPNGPAVKLWAWSRMQALAALERNRREVIATSLRHNLPSRFTSWLAIPEEERKNWARTIAHEQKRSLAREAIRLEIEGRGSSRDAAELHRELVALVRRDPAGYGGPDAVGQEVNALRSDALQTVTADLGVAVTGEVAAGRADGRHARRLRVLLAEACRRRRSQGEEGVRTDDVLREALIAGAEDRARDYAAHLADGTEGSPEARRARRERDTLVREAGARQQADHAFRWALEERLRGMAHEYVTGTRGQAYTWERDRETYEQFPVTSPIPKLSPGQATAVRRRLERLAPLAGKSARGLLNDAGYPFAILEQRSLRQRIVAERESPKPDPAKVARLEARYVDLAARAPWLPPTEVERERAYARERLKRIALRIEKRRLETALSDLDAALAKPVSDDERRVLVARRDAAKEAREEFRAQTGDPLLSVEAPADAESVVALLPGGETKVLAFDAASGRWQCRFDIPTYAAEGAYEVTAVARLSDGTRRTIPVRYHVDGSPADASASARRVGTGPLRLEIAAGSDAARVTALLPWGAAVELKPSAEAPGRFFASVPAPSGAAGDGASVTFFVTDRAHNRSRFTAAVRTD